MRRRFNYQFVFLFALAGLAVGGGLFFLHRRQVARQVADLPRLADRADAAGKPDRAVRLLTLYVAKRPADPDARLRLADLLGRRAETPYQVRQVMAEYERVLATDPGRGDLRRRVAELYLQQRVYKEALGHAEVLAKATPADPVVLDLIGRCHAALGDTERAAESFRRAVESPTAPLETYPRLASALLKLKKPADADAVVDRMVERHPTAHAAYLRRAAYRMERGAADPETTKKVKADFAEAIRLAPDDGDVLLLSAGLATEAKDRAAARRHLERGVAVHPADPRFHAALAQHELADGRRAEAVDVLKAGADKVGDRAETTLTMAELFLQLGGRVEARDMLKKAGTKLSPPEAVRAGLIEARVAMAEGDWPKAFRGLQQVRGQVADSSPRSVEIDVDLTVCAGALGLTDQRLVAARRAAKVAPDEPTVRYTLAAALIAAGRNDEAEEVLRPLAARQDITDPVLLDYAQVLLAQQRKAPTAPRIEAVAAVLKRLDDRKSTDPQVAVLKAELLLTRGDRDGARTVLTAARDKTPDRAELWVALAALDAKAGGPAAAGRVLKEAQDRVGDSPTLRVARFQLQYDPAAADAPQFLDRLADGTDTFPPAARLQLLLQLAAENARTGRTEVARQLLARVIGINPNSLGSWLYLCDIAAVAGDADALATGGAAIRRLEGPNGLLGQYAEASLLALKAAGGDKEAIPPARTLVQELTRLDPSSPRPFLLAARLDEIEGKTAAATAHLLTAVRNGDRRPDLIRRAVQQLVTQRRYAEADSLVRSIDPARLSPELRRTATQLSLQLDDTARAVELATKSADGKATPDDLHWRAFVYVAAGKPVEAETALRDAIHAGGGSECRVALVRLLAGTPGKTELARKEADALDAVVKTPADRLAAVECRQVLGDTAKADEHAKAALAAAPDDPTIVAAVAAHFVGTDRFPLAEPLLRRLATRGVPSKLEQVAEARRGLAAGLVAGGEWSRCQEALTLLDANEKEFPTDPANGPARAFALAGTPGRRKDAIRWYEDAQKRQALSPAQLQVLYGLYDLTGQWLKARATLEQYLGDGTRASAADLADGIDRHLRRSDPDGAIDWLRRLQKLEPTAVRTACLTARAAAKRGRKTEAVEALAAVTATAPADRSLLATTWEEIGEQTRAEAILTADAATGTITSLALVLFHGRTGAAPKAVEVCETMIRDGHPVDAVVAVLLDAVRGRGADPAVYDRIDKLIETAGDKLRWAEFFRADVRQEQARYAEAAALLDRFLAGHPENALAKARRGRIALLHEKNPAAALRLADAGIATDGPQTYLLDLKAAALAAAGQVDEAQAVVAGSDGDDAAVPFRLARLALATDRRRDAADQLRRALDAGLTERDLHPLERPQLKEMTTALGVRP